MLGDSRSMEHVFSDLTRMTLLIVGALFPIVNPPQSIPIYLSLTGGLPAESRSVLPRKIALNGFGLLFGSVLVGTHILAFFGISLPVVQMAGGLLLVAAGWKLLNRPDEDEKSQELPVKPVTPSYLSRRAFFPLTMPLTVGPGSISVAIAVGANRPPGSEGQWFLPVAALLGCTAVAAAIYVTYRYAREIGRFVGDSVMNVIIRLSSFILMCIGFQIGWNGISKLLASI